MFIDITKLLSKNLGHLSRRSIISIHVKYHHQPECPPNPNNLSHDNWRANFTCSLMFTAMTMLISKQLLIQKSLNPLHMTLLHGLVVLVYCIYIKTERSDCDISFGNSADRKWLIIYGGLKGISVMSLYFTLSYLGGGEAIAITYITPLLTPFFVWLILGGYYPPVKRVHCMLGLLAVILIVRSYENAISLSISGLRGSSAISLQYVVIEQMFDTIPRPVYILYCGLCTTIGSLICLASYPLSPFSLPRTSDSTLLILRVITGFLVLFNWDGSIQRHDFGNGVLQSKWIVYIPVEIGLLFDIFLWETPGFLSFVSIGIIITCLQALLNSITPRVSS